VAEEMAGAPMGGEEITDDDKLLPIIVLLMEDKKNRPFIKYNAVQSLALTVPVWVVSILLSWLGIGCIISLAWLIYVIYLAVKTYQGEWVTIPLITDFCKNQGWI
jgi:uncharacterized membrane protein